MSVVFLLLAAGAFLSTLSLRRATKKITKNIACSVISIHALLAESDQEQRENVGDMYQFLSTLSLRRATARFRWFAADSSYFYPRSPCGERQ